MKNIFVLAAAAALLVPFTSLADEAAKPPVVGKAPPDAPVPPPADGELKDPPRPPLFDTSAFPRDPASDKLILSIREKCYASPMSREGMSAQETKVCNAAVAQLAAKGNVATGSILAELATGESQYGANYYERTRLYYTLAKTDDPRVEDVLIRGYARLAVDNSEQLASEGGMIESTLATMNGTDPVGAEMLSETEVTDDAATAMEHVMILRQAQRDHADKAKGKMRTDALARARADKKSKDLKKQYLALSTLAQLSPNEAQPLLEKVVERDDLSDDQRTPFQMLEMQVYNNPAYVYPTY